MSIPAKDCEYDCDDADKSLMFSTNDNPPNSLMNDFSRHNINVTTRRTRSVADTASRETCTPPEDKILAMLETMNNNLAAQAVSLQNLHETCTATQNSLQFSQSDILDLQKKHELLEKENKSLHERILLLEKTDRDKDRRLNDIAQQCSTLLNELWHLIIA